MFDLLNLSSQHGRLALDLKLANIFTGLQPGSAKFPCIYGRYLKPSCFLWSQNKTKIYFFIESKVEEKTINLFKHGVIPV